MSKGLRVRDAIGVKVLQEKRLGVLATHQGPAALCALTSLERAQRMPMPLLCVQLCYIAWIRCVGCYMHKDCMVDTMRMINWPSLSCPGSAAVAVLVLGGEARSCNLQVRCDVTQWRLARASLVPYLGFCCISLELLCAEALCAQSWLEIKLWIVAGCAAHERGALMHRPVFSDLAAAAHEDWTGIALPSPATTHVRFGSLLQYRSMMEPCFQTSGPVAKSVRV
jgi:hypothetical protein